MLNSIPDEYSRPAGEPVMAYASPELYKQIQEGDHDLRLWQHKERELVGKKDLVYGNQKSGWVSVSKE